MPNDDGAGERADGGVETVDLDAPEDDDLPEWATEDPSIPGERSDAPDETGAGESDTNTDTTAESDERDDEPVDAATAVNFANVETGASASVPVGFSRTEADFGDTGGTSIDPDLDDVDPSDLLDAIDDEEFPRPGAAEETPTERPVPEASGRAKDGSVVPKDPAVSFGLGAVVMLVLATVYLLLSAALPPAAAGLTVAAGLVAVSVLGLVYVFDQRH